MRNTKVPPWWRANAQLNKAVRAIPTCGEPVGEGQNRTRTEGSRRESVTGDHLVGEGADAGDDHVDLVTDLHGADAVGGAGEDDVAGQERHDAGDVGDQRGDVEDQVAGRAVLLDLAVEVGLHA